MPRHNVVFFLAVVLFGLFAASQISVRDRVLISAIQTVEENALEPIDEKALFEGALEGLFLKSPYYPYSTYLPPEEQEAFEDEIQGVFFGIGICHMAIDSASGELWFTPFYDSPAWKAGLRFGERITAVGGEKIDGKSVGEIRAFLRGAENSSVRLTVRSRAGVLRRYGGNDSDPIGETREVQVPFGTVQTDIVGGDRRGEDGTWIFTLGGHPEIGYIRVMQFSDETVPLFKEALEKLETQNISSLIIDLRDNPGGFMEEAVSLCSFFLPKGTEIATVRKRGGKVQKRLTAEGGKKYGWKLAVLINHESASASEIVSGALADHGRAVLVGTRSYGKGTVQEIFSLPQNMGMIRLTCASFNRPNGKPIHRTTDAEDEDPWGISPEEENTVELDEYQQTASILLADMRSLPPEPDSQAEPLMRLIFDRAQKRDLFDSDEESPSSGIPETECDFATPESADLQLRRCIEILSERAE